MVQIYLFIIQNSHYSLLDHGLLPTNLILGFVDDVELILIMKLGYDITFVTFIRSTRQFFFFLSATSSRRYTSRFSEEQLHLSEFDLYGKRYSLWSLLFLLTRLPCHFCSDEYETGSHPQNFHVISGTLRSLYRTMTNPPDLYSCPLSPSNLSQTISSLSFFLLYMKLSKVDILSLHAKLLFIHKTCNRNFSTLHAEMECIKEIFWIKV